MRYQLLGGLEVTRQGTAIEITNKQQREVLAVLVLHANQRVSEDRLAAALWGDDPPKSWQASLARLVSRLRKLLEPSRLGDKQDGGYRLELHGDDRRDVNEFERLVGESSSDTAEPRDRAAAFEGARKLWRGDLLAGLLDEFDELKAARAHFNQLWLNARHRRFDDLLDNGLGADALAELKQMATQENTLDERSSRQYMRALYQVGRQKDSLAEYRRLKDALLDELGLDPQPDTQDLEVQILKHDPALLRSARASPSTPFSSGHDSRRGGPELPVTVSFEIGASPSDDDQHSRLDLHAERDASEAAPAAGLTLALSRELRSVHRSPAPPPSVDEFALGVAVMGLLRDASGDHVSVYKSLGVDGSGQLLDLMKGLVPSDPSVLERVIAALCNAGFFASGSQEAAATFLEREGQWALLDEYSRLRQKRRRLILAGTALEQEILVALRAPQLRDHHGRVIDRFKQLISIEDLAAKEEAMRDLEREVQREIGPATLLDYSRVDFQTNPLWGSHLSHGEEAQAQSHIASTNREIVTRFLKLTPPERRTLRVVDGGCGRGAFLVELCEQAGHLGDSAPNIEYFGCDIDPVATILTNELLNHQTADDAPKEVRRYPGQVAPLAPDEHWRGAHRFVEWDDMVSSFDRLARDGRDRDHKPIRGTVDVVVFCCTFHHVANNRALADSLSAPGAQEMDDLFQLGEALDKSAGLVRPLGRLYGAAAVFYEATLDLRRPQPWPIEDFLQDLTRDIRSHTDPTSVSRWGDLRALEPYISDEQAMLLASAAELLRPGGLLIIADPDGTSQWNCNKVTEIHKLPFTHFLSEAECRRLVDGTAGLQCCESGRIVQLFTTGPDNKYVYVGSDYEAWSRNATTITQLNREGFVDDNLVFVVIARRTP